MPQLFGRVWYQPDGRSRIFHETLEWNVQSRLKSYSYENLHYEPYRRNFTVDRQHENIRLQSLMYVVCCSSMDLDFQ
jgi:hypothetical protein